MPSRHLSCQQHRAGKGKHSASTGQSPRLQPHREQQPGSHGGEGVSVPDGDRRAAEGRGIQEALWEASQIPQAWGLEGHLKELGTEVR